MTGQGAEHAEGFVGHWTWRKVSPAKDASVATATALPAWSLASR